MAGCTESHADVDKLYAASVRRPHSGDCMMIGGWTRIVEYCKASCFILKYLEEEKTDIL